MPRRVLLAVAIVVVAAALVGVGVLLGRRVGDIPLGVLTAPPVGPQATAKPTTDATPPAGFTPFRAADAGFAIAYPSHWRRVPSTDPEIALLATPNGSDSFLVRVTDLGVTIADQDVPAMRDITDDIVAGGQGVAVLAGPERIELDGLPGLYYLYTFEDAATDQTGAHSHYFLFDGDRLVALVFQALPADGFEDLAPVFDRIAASFRVLPQG